ncbi:MAG TPA: chromosome segregation protein SMC [Verrucomicrobiae bacterium]|nr:chromosome segregation protein SMC [Verrucomicrobiae bacterium]
MSRNARLVALRLQGFKSFAERTVVEFAPGINAVVGPNGSGKSNLADALRWALGEQGRAIRSRKSEDVVFAGSERRSALGMADVTLVLDNADGLVPVEFVQIELGRRLYRSGENDYLVNRQRVRLRDLVDLLDAAHLAENAFLFIGQGMVDQALALRPEERRPLFEEVAGVRRHERRRRKAEEQLEEATANIARVEDILGELRPQARRLAAQAEQQATRARAGEELAAALVAALGTRWHVAASSHRAAGLDLDRARRAAAAALDALQGAEGAAADAARDLGARAEIEQAARAAHEDARSALAVLQLDAARASAEAAGITRDRDRLAAERAAAEAEISARRRELALPVPEPDRALEAELADVDRALAEARGEAQALRVATVARSEAAAALQRARVTRVTERDGLRSRLTEVERRLAEEAAAAEATAARSSGLDLEAASLRAAAEAARSEEIAAARTRDDARATAATAEAARLAAADASAGAGALAATLRGRLAALQAALAEDETRGIGRAARRLGGRAMAAGLDVDPALRVAVSAALGELARSYVVGRDNLGALSGERGLLVLGDAAGPGATRPPAAEAAAVRVAVARTGGGLLADAVRVDAAGTASRILSRCAWVPTLVDALDVAAALPAGWRVAARTGAVVTADGTVSLGIADAGLERRAEADALGRDVVAAEAARDDAAARLAAAEAAAATARAGHDDARRTEADVAARRRAAEEAERRASRDVEQATREAGWHASRAAALRVERAAFAERLAVLEAAAAAAADDAAAGVPAAFADAGAAPRDEDGALAAWEARIADLRGRHERLTADRAARDLERRAADDRRARADASATLAEERISRADAEATVLAVRDETLVARRAARELDLAGASAREGAARSTLDRCLADDAADRDRLRRAETAVAAAREALRRAEEVAGAATVRELEARLGLDAVREQALVELAGLGELGVGALTLVGAGPADAARDARPDPGPHSDAGDDDGARLAAALGRAGERWEIAAPAAEGPSAGRLAGLRRRFHEMGAANPFALEEHTAVRARLDELDGQRRDLDRAIDRTRALIAELDALISAQFRATFLALEAAFDRRFQQLFGGGFARLSLTDPTDLAATGVEIVARPPGKKAQALSMLSGGERALTAVALLFAMLEVRPVPFCVLDEVDAALDEANVGRFVEALRELAASTQFVVITHNRGTIEAADALFGITVGDDAVSRVISLRLDEATAIADRVARVDGRRERATADPAPAG